MGVNTQRQSQLRPLSHDKGRSCHVWCEYSPREAGGVVEGRRSGGNTCTDLNSQGLQWVAALRLEVAGRRSEGGEPRRFSIVVADDAKAQLVQGLDGVR